MQSRVGSERHTNFIVTNRPDSSQLVDLHVYVIPKTVWKNHQNLAENITMQQAVSAGFVRVPGDLSIHDLRRFINEVCGADENFPKEWIYLRSVGRCLTKVKQQQEKELKVKNYRPPTVVAPEIYVIEDDHDNNSMVSARGHDERSLQDSSMWIKPIASNHHMISSPASTARLSARNLLKIREEQKRLYHRQIELAQKRLQIQDQYQKEEEAATKIQNAFRNYRHRSNIKQQQADAIEIERLQKQAQQLTRRQVEVEHAEEKQAKDVVRLSNRLEELRLKRIELEANRMLIIRRIQRLQTQITIRRREEKDLWKKKYLIEKKQNAAVEEQNYPLSKNPTDIEHQLEQTKIGLNNSIKLRQQAEYESRLLRQELHEISSNLNILERYRLPKQQQQHITLQY